MPLPTAAGLPFLKFLFFVFVVGLLCVPQNAPIRNLTPGNWEKVLELKPPTGLKFVPGDTIEFDVAINSSAEVFEEALDITKVLLMEKEPHRSQVLEVARKRPYLFAWRIRIPVEVLGPEPTCRLQLKIADHASLFEPCENAIDHKARFFEFSSPVLPGIFKATLLVENAKDTDYFVVHGFPGKDKSFWVPVESANRLSTLVALWRWSAGHFMFAFGVGLLLTVVLGSALFWLGKESAWRKLLFCTAVSTLGIAFLITPLLSGHDETAHLTMFRMGALQALEGSTPASPEQEASFNRQAEKTKFDFNFFRLHNVQPQTNGSCPHMAATGSCGESEKPIWLYKQYAKGLAFTSPQNWSPEAILWFGRGASVFWLAFFTGAALLFFGGEFIPFLLFAAVLCGAYLGQFASLTNDVPMYGLGFFLFVALSSTFRDPPTLKSALGLLFGVVSVFVLKNSERSWISALPTLCLAIGIYMAKILFLKTQIFAGTNAFIKQRFVPATQEPATRLFVFLFPVGVAASGLVFCLALAHFAPSLKIAFPTYWNLLIQLSPDAAMLEEFAKADLKGFAHILFYHLRSVWGSFVWGHEYYPKWFNLAGLATLIFSLVSAALICFNFAVKGNTKAYFKGCGAFAIAGMLFGIHMVLIASIAWPYVYQPLIVSESFLKLRLIAPSSSHLYFIFFLPFVLGYPRESTPQPIYLNLFKLALILCLVIGAFLQPAIYLIPQW